METVALFSIITLGVIAGNLVSLLICGFYFQKVFKSVEANIDINARGEANEN